jgi:hypothetical protein
MDALRVTIFTLCALSVALDAAAQSSGIRFREMDRNNDGVITRQEWRGTAQAFRDNDWNRDNVLSGDEVRAEDFWATGETSNERSEVAVDQEARFESLDANRDGRIERSEWTGSDDAWTWLDRDNDNVLSRREVVGNARRGSVASTRRAERRRGESAVIGSAEQQECVTSAPQIVDDIYQQVLERPADQASAELSQALASGRMTVRDVVARVAKSPEHAQRFFWQPAAAAVYRRIMQRDPSQGEMRDITTDLQARRPMPEIVARIAGRAESNPADAVSILYRGLLGRDADPEGLRIHTELARRDGLEAVARSIQNSPEYRQRTAAVTEAENMSFDGTVRTLSRHVLGREVDQEGRRSLRQVAAAYGFDGVVDRLIASPDYERLYGTDVVPGRNARYCGTTQ